MFQLQSLFLIHKQFSLSGAFTKGQFFCKTGNTNILKIWLVICQGKQMDTT